MMKVEKILKLGQVVVTTGARDSLDMNDVQVALMRHQMYDWGNVCKEDKKANDEAVIEGDRILSSYESKGTKFWIITEWNRSATTILLPEEY